MDSRSCFAAALLMSAPGLGQWINKPSASVPRGKDGRPDLAAPAPRTPDNHPDLSGIWDIEHNRACPPEACNDMFIGQEFVSIGWSLKGGLPYKPWARDVVKTRMAARGDGDPITHCLPRGIVKMCADPLINTIVQTPRLQVILSERSAT